MIIIYNTHLYIKTMSCYDEQYLNAPLEGAYLADLLSNTGLNMNS